MENILKTFLVAVQSQLRNIKDAVKETASLTRIICIACARIDRQAAKTVAGMSRAEVAEAYPSAPVAEGRKHLRKRLRNAAVAELRRSKSLSVTVSQAFAMLDRSSAARRNWAQGKYIPKLGKPQGNGSGKKRFSTIALAFIGQYINSEARARALLHLIKEVVKAKGWEV